jgi:PKD repeat protein
MQASNLTWRNKTSQITLKNMLAAGGLLVSGFFLMPHSLNGQEVAGAPEHYQTRPSPHFKPNKGQVADHECNLIKAYEYVYQAPGMKVGLNQNGFHYNLYTVEKKPTADKKVSEATGKPVNENQNPLKPSRKDETQTTYHYHRVEVEFKGANEDPEIIAEAKMDYYANYYLGYLPEYVTKVHGYRKLTYKNLYDNIDLVLRSSTAEKGRPKLKYNIRVRPGGDLSDVKMVYKGMDKLSLKDGKLQIATSQGRMTETIPESYWAESKEATTVNYQLEGNTVSFQAKQEQEGQTLVVDPSLKWSTYLGGSLPNDEGLDVTTDGSGNVYLTGRAGGLFPTTSGAYQSSFGRGFNDAFLSKFTTSGSLSWSTYLGGNNFDRGNSVTTDGSGNVYVTGYADIGFPTTSGAYQQSFSGGTYDAFLSKFTSGGSLSWSTFLGGSSDDIGGSVTTDNSGYLYVTGYASSGFPTTNGTYQQFYGGGSDDAFLSKFNSSGSLSWSTYLGGSNFDQGKAVTTDGSGNVYVTGEADTTFPTTSGAYQQSFEGGGDAFLSKFTNSGSLSWSTYLGGPGSDQGNSISVNSSGNVYVTGNAQFGFPTTSGAYQDSFGRGYGFRGSDAFLSKFNSSGSLNWSTLLGGGDEDYGNGVTTDNSGNVYVTGETESTAFPTTIGAYKTSYSGGFGDAFLSKFNSSGSLSWSTFLGGSSKEEGNSVTTDRNANVFISGFARSGFPTTSGAYQTSNGGGRDAFISKLNPPQKPKAGFVADSGCNEDTLQFVNTSSLQINDTIIRYNWNFGDGSSDSGQSVSHAYRSAGTYTVELIVTTAEGLKDTATQKAQVFYNPSASFSVNDRLQCLRDSFQFTDQSTITTGSLSSYEWSFGDGDSSQSQNPIHQYSSADSFTVGLFVTSDQGCEDSISQQVTVNPNPSASFTVNDRLQCQRDTFQFTNQSTISTGSLSSYEWSFGDGDSSQRQNPVHHYSTADSFTASLSQSASNSQSNAQQ